MCARAHVCVWAGDGGRCLMAFFGVNFTLCFDIGCFNSSMKCTRLGLIRERALREGAIIFFSAYLVQNVTRVSFQMSLGTFFSFWRWREKNANKRKNEVGLWKQRHCIHTHTRTRTAMSLLKLRRHNAILVGWEILVVSRSKVQETHLKKIIIVRIFFYNKHKKSRENI